MPTIPGDELDDEAKNLICEHLAGEDRAPALLATDLNLSKEDILASEAAWKSRLDAAKQCDQAVTSPEAERKAATGRS
jgi:hypothetical protein